MSKPVALGLTLETTIVVKQPRQDGSKAVEVFEVQPDGSRLLVDSYLEVPDGAS